MSRLMDRRAGLSGSRQGIARAPRATKSAAEARSEVEQFTRAMEAYKRRSGRKFPTWSEVLEVLHGLGYQKPREPGSPGPPVCRGRRLMVVQAGPARIPIGRLLADRGGIALPMPGPPLYEFPSPRIRDEAMDAARDAFGWTCVEPRL